MKSTKILDSNQRPTVVTGPSEWLSSYHQHNWWSRISGLGFICCLTTAFFILICAPRIATPSISIDANEQFQYAVKLYSQKKFSIAIVELERFLHLFPTDARSSEARFQLGLAHFQLKAYYHAMQSFRDIVDQKDQDSAFHIQAFYMLSECQLGMGQRSAALTTLYNLVTISQDVQVRDEAYYRMGWIYLEMYSWDKAQAAFGNISHQNQTRYRLKDLLSQLEARQKIAYKKPGLAGTLAIIPGAGYLYCNRYKDALISFVLNGGLIYAAYEAFENDLVALGSVVTFVEIGFYSGNIYGSISSAHKYNRDQDRRLVNRLKENLKLNLSARPESKGVEITLSYKF